MKKQCRKCDNKTNWMGIEYAYGSPERYDGVSEWVCNKCKTHYGRWSDKILLNGESEKRFGRK